MKKPLIYIGIIILVGIAVYFSGLFSLVTLDEGFSSFRQERNCGLESTYIFDNKRMEYRTIQLNVNEVRPGYNQNNYCVPSIIRFYEDGTKRFEWNRESGVIVNNIGDDYTIVMENSWVSIPNWQMAGNGIHSFDLISNDGLYEYYLRNRGWSSSGNTLGSRLTFRMLTREADITMEVLSTEKDILENNQIQVRINNNENFGIEYSNICLNYESDGVFGKQTKTECQPQTGIIQGGSSQVLTFPTPQTTGVIDYKVRISIDRITVLVSSVTTTSIVQADLERYLISSTKVWGGKFNTEFISVSELSLYSEQINQLEGNIQAQINYISELELTSNQLSVVINDLEWSINEKILLIEQLQLSQEEMAITISQLEVTNQELALMIEELELETQAQIVLINNLEATVQEQAEFIALLELTTQQQVQLISGLELQIQEQAEMINILVDNLEEKAFLVSQLQATNEEQGALIAQMELSFTEQAGIIQQLNYVIEEDAQVIQGMSLSLQEQSLLIDELQLTNQELTLLIGNLTQNIEQQATIIANLKISNEEKAKIILELRAKIDEQALLISNMRLQLKDQQELIDAMELEIAQREELEGLIDGYKRQAQLQTYVIIGMAVILIGLIVALVIRGKKK